MGCTYQYIGQIAKEEGLDRRKTREIPDDFLVSCKQKYNTKKYLCVKKGIEFLVEFHEIDWVKECPITGITLDYFKESPGKDSPYLNLKDLTKGYTKENTIVTALFVYYCKSSNNII